MEFKRESGLTVMKLNDMTWDADLEIRQYDDGTHIVWGLIDGGPGQSFWENLTQSNCLAGAVKELGQILLSNIHIYEEE